MFGHPPKKRPWYWIKEIICSLVCDVMCPGHCLSPYIYHVQTSLRLFLFLFCYIQYVDIVAWCACLSWLNSGVQRTILRIQVSVEHGRPHGNNQKKLVILLREQTRKKNKSGLSFYSIEYSGWYSFVMCQPDSVWFFYLPNGDTCTVQAKNNGRRYPSITKAQVESLMKRKIIVESFWMNNVEWGLLETKRIILHSLVNKRKCNQWWTPTHGPDPCQFIN